MAGRDEAMTTEEPGKAQTGRKKRMHLRIGGPGILVGVLAVAVVVGAAIRIRRHRSLHEAKKRIQHSCSDDRSGGLRSVLQEYEDHDRSGGLRSILQEYEDHPRCYTRDVAAEMMEHVTVEHEIEMEKIGENEGDEASDTDHGEWMAKEISESSAEGEDEEGEDSANEGKDEEDSDEVTAREAEEEDAQDKVAGYKAKENDDVNDDDDDKEEEEEEEDEEEEEEEDKNIEECVVEKCEEGSKGTEDSSMESNAEVVWPAEMKEWPLEIKEMKVSYQDGRIPKTRSYNFLYKVERRIPVKIKLKIWIWTTLMLLLLLLFSVTNQKIYVSLYY